MGILVGGDILVATLPRVSLRVPYMKRVYRVPLGYYCSSVIHHKHTHLLGLLLGPSCGGDLESFPQVLPGSGMQDEGLGYY